MALRMSQTSLSRASSQASARRMAFSAPRVARVGGRRVAVRVIEETELGEVVIPRNQHPHPEFIKETLAKFPEEGVANVEECLVLWLEGGYKMLDVRSEREKDYGSIRGSIHVPYTKAKKTWVDGKMQVETVKVPVAEWVKAVNAKIPKKDTKFIVHDMVGKQAIECLEALFEDGYENIVGMKGGFKPWFKTFDYNLRRRTFGEYAENYSKNDVLANGDSCGIHASGAGFQNQDRLSGDFWDNF